MSLTVLASFSHRYGKNPAFVLAGGGNTSFKTADSLYIKGSGTALATIPEEGFVRMDRRRLAAIWQKTYPAGQAEREADVLADMMAARWAGEEKKRPSVETLLHDLFPQTYVLHLHPTAVNALTCSVRGEEMAGQMFPAAVWIPECEPGYILASHCRERMQAYRERTGHDACVVFLQNHGIFFAAETEDGLDALAADVMGKLDACFTVRPDFTPLAMEADRERVDGIAAVLRTCYAEDGQTGVLFAANPTILHYAASPEAFATLREPLSPDHIVYCKAEPLFLTDTQSRTPDGIRKAYRELAERRGFRPKVVFVQGLGQFTLGQDDGDARTAAAVWQDCLSITTLAEAFGGVRHMAPELADFIVHWEVESYRSRVQASAGK